MRFNPFAAKRPLRKMYDAIELLHPAPTVEVTAFYIGGEDAYRVWPNSEIRGIRTRYRLPIWVNSNPSDYNQGLRDGRTAGNWGQKHNQQKGTCIAWDAEMAVNSGYLKGFDKGVKEKGFKCIVYGSRSAVLRNPKPSGGYWVAQWDDVASTKWAAKQYANRGRYDISVVADSTSLWDVRASKPMSEDA